MSDVRTEGEPGWFASLLGAGVLIAGGFALGLVAGVVSEEPELVVGHLVGRSEEAWLPDALPELTPSGSAEAFGSETGIGVRRQETAPEIVSVQQVESLDAGDMLPPVSADAPARRPARADPGSRAIDSLPSRSTSPAVTPDARAGFAVQVGAFADAVAAQDVRQKLRRKGFESFVIPAAESGDGKWRVRVGPVPTRGAADRLAARLKREERLPTWVLAQGGDS